MFCPYAADIRRGDGGIERAGMSGVFLSYSRVDRALAEQVTQALRAVGVDVWWDEDMGGVDWQEELERKIETLAAVVVLWSEASSASKPVRDEARLALSAEKLVNALAGLKQPPFPFDRVNGLPLEGWSPGEPHRGFERLVQTVEGLVVQSGGARPGEFTEALSRQEEERQLKHQNIARLTEAVHDAQGREEDAREAARIAQDAFDREQEQFQKFVDLRPGQRVLGAAQAELDIVRATADKADETHQASVFALREAERMLAAAQRDLAAPAPRPLPPVRPVAAPIKAVAKPAAPPPVKPAPKPTPKPVVAAEPAPPKPAPVAPPVVDMGELTVISGRRPAPDKPASTLFTPPKIAAAAVVVVLIAVIGLFGGRLLAAKSPATPAPDSGAPSATPAAVDPAKAAIEQDASALAGNWAMQGLSCDQPVTISVKADSLSMVSSGQTFTGTLAATTRPELIKAQDSEGDWSFRLAGHDQLQVAGPGGLVLKMTRCAG